VKRVVHCINLHDVGGVQQMFVPFYERAKEESSFFHSVVGLGECDEQFVGIDRYVNLTASFFHQLQFIRSLIDRETIVHFHNMLGGKKIAALLHWLPVKNVVFTDQGASWYCNDSNRSNYIRNAQVSRWIIANSKATQTMLHTNAEVPMDKIQVIYNGFLRSTQARISEEPTDRGIQVGYIGRFAAFKGVHILIESARRLLGEKDISFSIAGSGGCEDRLRENAKDLSNVTFVGKVSDPLRFISEMDIIVVPSTREPIPNVIVEAGFMKKAVISANVDGIPEQIENGKTGVLLPCEKSVTYRDALYPDVVVDPALHVLRKPQEIDALLLADAIKALAHDAKSRKRYGEALYEKVTEQHSFDTYFTSVEKMYAGMVN